MGIRQPEGDMFTGLRRSLATLLACGFIGATTGPAFGEMGDLITDHAFGQTDLFHAIGLPVAQITALRGRWAP
jgi:hypothetical protein